MQNIALEQKDKALEQKTKEMLEQKKDFAKILSSMGLSKEQIANKLDISEQLVEKLLE